MFSKFFTACILLSVTILSHAQTDKSKKEAPDKGSPAKYLEDGKLKNTNNLIRIRTNRLVAGYLGLSYERKFTHKFGLEVGAYYKPFKYFTTTDYARQEFADNPEGFYAGTTTGGMCYMAYPKLYLSGKSINNGYYVGARNYFSTYTASTNPEHGIAQNNIPGQSFSSFFMFGSHQQMGGRFVFGLEFGGGYFRDVYKGVQTYEIDYMTWNNATKMTQKDIVLQGFNVSMDIIFGVLF